MSEFDTTDLLSPSYNEEGAIAAIDPNRENPFRTSVTESGSADISEEIQKKLATADISSSSETLPVDTLIVGADATQVSPASEREKTLEIAGNTDPFTGETAVADTSGDYTAELTERNAANLFDATYYAAENPDLGNAGLTTPEQLYEHFQQFGLDEGRCCSPLVDLPFYRESNPDLAEAGVTSEKQLYEHLQTFGIKEGRRFSPFVDVKYYLESHPDLVEAFGDNLKLAWEHLQKYGIAEGRKFSPWVDLKYYFANNPDVGEAFGEDYKQALEHLEKYGLAEGRKFSPEIDLEFYLSSNADLLAAFGSDRKRAIAHWQMFGIAEGRKCLPDMPSPISGESPEVESGLDGLATAENSAVLAENPSEGVTAGNLEGLEGWEEEEKGAIATSGISQEIENQPPAPVTSGDSQQIENHSPAPVTSGDAATAPDNTSETVKSGDTATAPENTSPPITAGDTAGTVDEGTAPIPPSDAAEGGEKLTPTVTPLKTVMGLEAEPTPPKDLPENAGGGNAKKDAAPKHLQFSTTQEEYFKNEPIRLKDAWAFDASGAGDLDRVEFSLHKPGDKWQDIESGNSFNTSSKDGRWGWFNYSLSGLAPGKYQLKGVAYDKQGGKSNTAVVQFTVSDKSAPMPLMGIIDTGFAENNPDIDYSRITKGKDWVDGDDNPLLKAGEGNEHGTHILGILAATQNNGVGIYGMNDRAPIWAGRAVGSGKWAESLIEFVDFAKASGNPNALVNLSLDLTQVNADGSVTTRYEFTPREREALEYARQNHVLIVVAAGNDGSVMSVLGQAAQEFDNIITVGAANGNRRADYSSFGHRGPDIVAEGGSIANPITSTVGEDVGTMAGTSVATAQVTGAASLLWEANPQLNYRQVIEALKESATDLNVAGFDSETGAGLLNPDKAVETAKATTPEVYAPEAFLTPDTWSGEGVVTPEERAVEFNYPIVEESFFGIVSPEIGLNLRYSNSLEDRSDQNVANGETLYFDAWTYGEVSTDYIYGNADALWYRVEGTNYWVPSAYIQNYPPSNPPVLPPEDYQQTQDEGDNFTFTPPGDSFVVYDETGHISEIGSNTGFGDSGTTNSEPPAPSFQPYHRFEGAYEENAWIGAPIGEPYISSSGFVSQEFENAYLEYNGSDRVYMYQKKAEESTFDSVPSNEPIPSAKGSLIRTGGSSSFDEEFEYLQSRIQEQFKSGIQISDNEMNRYFEAYVINEIIQEYEKVHEVDTAFEKYHQEQGHNYTGANHFTLDGVSIDYAVRPSSEFVEMWKLLFKFELSDKNNGATAGYLDFLTVDAVGEEHGNTYHGGIDFNVVTGTEVKSLVGGKVVKVEGATGDGTIAIYNSQLDKTFLYLHMSSSQVVDKQEISAGTIIGKSGTTGGVDPHLHLEVQSGLQTTARGITQRKTWEQTEANTVNVMRAFLEAKYFDLLEKNAPIDSSGTMVKERTSWDPETGGKLNHKYQFDPLTGLTTTFTLNLETGVSISKIYNPLTGVISVS